MTAKVWVADSPDTIFPLPVRKYSAVGFNWARKRSSKVPEDCLEYFSLSEVSHIP